MFSSNNNTTTTTGSDPTLTNTGAVGNSSSNIITITSSFAREHLQKLALSDTRKLTTMISALDQDRHVGLLSVIACYTVLMVGFTAVLLLYIGRLTSRI